MDRRRFLRTAGLTGAGVVVAGGAAAAYRASNVGLFPSDPSPFEAWDALEGQKPGAAEGLLAAAILASNPHNTQPWRLGADETLFVVEADPNRHLGAFDPFRREMWIGLGGAVACAEVAAPGLGFRLGEPQVVQTGPAGAGRIEAAISRVDPTPHPLASGLSARRTNRASYDPAPVPLETLQQVLSLAGEAPGVRLAIHPRDSDAGQAFAAATVSATEAINGDAEMSGDGHRWFRHNPRDVARHRDGVAVATSGLSPVMSALGQMLPPMDAATAGGYWLDSTRRQVEGAGGFGWMLVDDLDDRNAQLAVGRLWQRLHLALTGAGLAGHPLNQLPEMVDRDRQLGRSGPWAAQAAALAPEGGRLTFGFRFGGPLREVPHSARRQLDAVRLQAT
ncbi:MAG: hypothetical protein Q7S93_14710 [Phenylobacterium sp.]|uniref:hypothetical protein n=1 Tax=Phenylobacterium sp. TaxID=1871053 RepID=UPI00271F11E3|nr:hypothetical protein [Phenylobacterium sp.]MDO8411303.1 hypothetical protein [Phenylobacterium sp.]